MQLSCLIQDVYFCNRQIITEVHNWPKGIDQPAAVCSTPINTFYSATPVFKVQGTPQKKEERLKSQRTRIPAMRVSSTKIKRGHDMRGW